MDKAQKFKLLILQARYLKAQLAADKDTHSASMVEFSREFNRMMKTLPPQEQKVIQSATTKGFGADKKKRPVSNTEGSNPKKVEESLRKTFQDVAKKTHPDKLLDLVQEEKKYKESLFKQAQAAVEEKDLMGLFDVAEKLNIEMPAPNEEQIALLKNDIKRTRKKIKEMKSTASWEWFHAETVDKKAIMMSYLTMLFHSFNK